MRAARERFAALEMRMRKLARCVRQDQKVAPMSCHQM